jgi:mannosyltransferase OCH1-like enzyme
LKKYKLPGSDQILAELIQEASKMPAIHKIINFIWNKEELPDQWKDYCISSQKG